MDERIGALLALQRPDGNWGVGVYDPDDWCSTIDALWLLHELDAPADDPGVRRAVDLVHERVRWEERHGGLPFFQGETEACVNGRVLALGARFGRPDAVLADRLIGEQLADGGWNCRAPASARGSFHSTICVLEGLLGFARAVGTSAVLQGALDRGHDHLLDRGLFRSRSTGRVLDEAWLVPHAPVYWCYDVLRGLDHLRDAGVAPDDRIADAVETVRRARRPDGGWASAPAVEAEQVLVVEPPGAPSALIAERAARVIAWAEG